MRMAAPLATLRAFSASSRSYASEAGGGGGDGDGVEVFAWTSATGWDAFLGVRLNLGAAGPALGLTRGGGGGGGGSGCGGRGRGFVLALPHRVRRGGLARGHRAVIFLNFLIIFLVDRGQVEGRLGVHASDDVVAEGVDHAAVLVGGLVDRLLAGLAGG